MKLRKLILVQLRSQFLTGRGKRSGIAAMILPFAAMIYLSVLYSLQLYRVLSPSQYGSGLMTMAAGGYLLVLVVGVNLAQGSLFGYKDFDFLRSLPISDRDIVAAKLVPFIVTMYLYAGFYVIPAMIIYGIFAHAGWQFYVSALAGFLTMPASAVIISSFLALFIRKVSAGRKHPDLIRNVFSVVFVLAIVVGSSMLGAAEVSADEVIGTISGYARFLVLVRLYVQACIGHDLLKLLLVMAAGIALLLVFVRLVSPLIISAGEQGEITRHDSNFRITRMKRSSPVRALLGKEIQIYLRNFSYMMNTAVGMIMLLTVGVMLVFERLTKGTIFGIPLDTIGMFREAAGYIIILIIGLAVHMSCTTGSSISLEGKYFWLTKTMPVTEGQIFTAKAGVNLLITAVPMIPAMILIGAALGMPAGYYIYGILHILAASLFVSMFGLVINLCFPKFEYDREVQVIKQSASAFISLLGSMAIGIIILVVTIIRIGDTYTLWKWMTAVTLGYILTDVILLVILREWGVKRFRRLA